MSDQPAFSIVVPTRDRPDYLRTCLDGIRSQACQDYEVLIIDDGSSQEVREAYRDLITSYGERFRLIPNNPPGSRGAGPSASRNLGLAQAKGRYIAFCDDDDYWCRDDHLAVALRALETTNADLYLSNQRAVAPDGEVVIDVLMRNVARLAPMRPELSPGVHRLSPEDALFHPDYAHLNIIIVSRHLIDRIGGFWERTSYTEDVHFFVRACDGAEGILYRAEICAVHNVPARRAQADSVSTCLQHLDKRMLETMVYQHLLCVVERPAAIRYARLSLNNLQKMIASEQEKEGRHRVAALFAANALATLPRLKWSVKSALLGIKSLASRGSSR